MDSVNKRNIDLSKLLIYFLLIVYGCVLGYFILKNTVLATPLYGQPLSSFYMWLRVDWLDYFINEVNSTGIYTGLHRLFDHNAAVYLYLSHVGHFLGTDAVNTFYYTQLALMCGCAALYPVIFYRITHSLPVALASILFFRIYAPYSVYLMNDSYYIYGWMTFISLPVLFFLFRDRWEGENYLWIVLLLVVMSVSNVFRSSAGLAIAVSLMALMLVKLILPAFRSKNYVTMAAGIIICFAALWGQSLFTSTVPGIYQKAVGQPEPLPIKGPWHSLYVGLGWEENPFGLQYQDEYGYEGRQELLYNTEEGYYIGIESPEYIEEMKSVYMDTVFSDPVFFAGSYIRKAFTALKTIADNTIANIIILGNGWFYPTRFTQLLSVITPLTAIYYLSVKWKSDKKKTIARLISTAFIGIVNITFGIIPGIIANPLVREYTFGATATLDCIVLAEYIIFVYMVSEWVKHLLNNKQKSQKHTVKN